MASQTEGIILSTVVTLNGKSNRLTLSGSHLCWSPTFPERAQYHQHYVKVTEIITVKAEYEFHPGGHYEKYSKYSKINTIELLPKKSNVFSVYMIKRNGRHKWKDRKVSFHCRDSSCANDWIENINRTINKQDVSRPQRLLVFINPVGGKGKGCKIYREKVAPLFELAGIVTEVIVTERSNHAKDILQEKELHKIDGVISVSGDGMASEVVNGLLLRAQKDAGINFNDKKSKLVSLSHRVGIIPAGSTDTIVHSTVGTSDPVTSTLHIILGDSQPLDVCSVHNRDELLQYTMSFVGYGFFGDLLKDSERHRWMGPTRYDFSGFKKFVSNKYYDCEVSFLQSMDGDSGPHDCTRCRMGCAICHRAGDRIQQLQFSDSSDMDKVLPQETMGSGNWQRVSGQFIGVNASIMSCSCDKSRDGMSPSAHLADGCMDLILIHHCDHVQYLRYLHRVSSTANQFDFPFVQVHRVKEFKLRPLVQDIGAEEDTMDGNNIGSGAISGRFTQDKKKCKHHPLPSMSVWNADGEIIHHPSVDVKVHCQLIQLFARGIEDNEEDTRTSCASCSRKCY